jgi:hypothetical protein
MQEYTDRQIEWRYSNNLMDFKNHVINTFSYDPVHYTCRCRCKPLS